MKRLNLREVEQNIHNHSANKRQIHYQKQALFYNMVHALPACHRPTLSPHIKKKNIFKIMFQQLLFLNLLNIFSMSKRFFAFPPDQPSSNSISNFPRMSQPQLLQYESSTSNPHPNHTIIFRNQKTGVKQGLHHLLCQWTNVAKLSEKKPSSNFQIENCEAPPSHFCTNGFSDLEVSPSLG